MRGAFDGNARRVWAQVPANRAVVVRPISWFLGARWRFVVVMAFVFVFVGVRVLCVQRCEVGALGVNYAPPFGAGVVGDQLGFLKWGKV